MLFSCVVFTVDIGYVVVNVYVVCKLVTVQDWISPLHSDSGFQLISCCGLNRVLRQRAPSYYTAGAEEFVFQSRYPPYTKSLIT